VDQALNIGRLPFGRMIRIARESPEGLQLQSTFSIGTDTERLPDTEAPCFPPNWLFKRLSGESDLATGARRGRDASRF